jgi:hypothetical protein
MYISVFDRQISLFMYAGLIIKVKESMWAVLLYKYVHQLEWENKEKRKD